MCLVYGLMLYLQYVPAHPKDTHGQRGCNVGTLLLVNKCSSVQVCGGERPHQYGSGPPAVLGYMVWG